jgi:DNA mismatch repair protein MutL
MGQIKILDQNMINMIAAGEVIERPASVVKELVENSIDAGATKIVVSVEDGGRKLISVSDNGCGMDAEDLSFAFESHATSKVTTSTDLHRISSFGFRGEALASIASVAQVKAVSRTKESPSANCIEIDCGQKTTVGPCSGDYGTTISVRDIFYKLPARRKFLRTANTEMSHISEQFTRIALANCDAERNLDLTLIHNNRELYRLSQKDSLANRIDAFFASGTSTISDNLIETQNKEKGIHIHALLGTPEISKTSNKLEYIFLNKRFIRDRFISHAIREAYRGLLEPARYPVVFLFIEMPYEDYDVNVHPTKIEVRFFNANLVHSQVLAVIREKLLSVNLQMPARIPIQGEQSNNTVLNNAVVASAPNQKIAEAMAEFFKRHSPMHQKDIEFHYNSKDKFHPAPSGKYTSAGHAEIQTDRKFIQLHDSYIVAQTAEGFVLIDQHALHERIIYEQLRQRLQSGKLSAQRLLIPATIHLDTGRSDLIEQNKDLFGKLGIEIASGEFGEIAIKSFPAMLKNADPLDFVQDLIDILDNKNITADPDKLLDEVLSMAACKAAIKAGNRLADSEIEQLLADKEKIDYSSRCPHGRPSIIEFTLSELEKQFKRT